MDERTRLPEPGLDGAGAFAEYIADWMRRYGSLIDAIGTLRLLKSEPDALKALLATRPVRHIVEAWELWNSWTEASGHSAEARLEVHLGIDATAKFRIELWDQGAPSAEVGERTDAK